MKQEISNESEKNIFEAALKTCGEQHESQSSAKLLETLLQLDAAHNLIRDPASNPELGSAIESATEALKQYVTYDFIEKGLGREGYNNSHNWKLQAQTREQLAGLTLRCSRRTLQEIGEQLHPPISRERARQMEAKVAKILGIKSSELADKTKERQEEQNRLKEMKAMKRWIRDLDRLPIPNDQRATDEKNPELWFKITQLDLKGRCNLLSQHQLAITDAEYDYHFDCVTSKMAAGKGYWRNFENLKQFVIRLQSSLKPN